MAKAVIALIAALMLAGCEEGGSCTSPTGSVSYTITQDGQGFACWGTAYVEARPSAGDFDTMICSWECVQDDGRLWHGVDVWLGRTRGGPWAVSQTVRY